MNLLIFIYLYLFQFTLGVNVNARFFTTDARNLESYPEYEYIKNKPNVAICFSGGGTRSYEATLGYLQALKSADLLKNARYISSVSGGSWANAVFSYHDENMVNLDELLGEYTPPEEITLATLKIIPFKSARLYPVRMNIIALVVFHLLFLGTPAEEVWVKAIHETFLKPAGIPLYSLPTWNRNTLSETLSRNPHLLNQLDFRFPCNGKETVICQGNIPFPIFNTAMLGPIEAAPFGLFQRRYVMMQGTPLYVGFPRVQNITYPSATPHAKLALGGLVEPIGFGAPIKDETFCGLAECPFPKEKDIPLPYRPFGIANITAASSWAPGALVAEEPVLAPLDNVLLTAPYFSPHFGGKTREVFVGDGANMENQGLISLLQRKVKKICMFINSPVPLSDAEAYNPHIRWPSQDTDIDSSITALFGIRTFLPPLAEDFKHIQVFRKVDFARVVSALQNAQKAGNGAVAALDLTTIENRWWGVSAGHKVHMVFIYLGRVYNWEDALTTKVAALIAPNRKNRKPHNLPAQGTFKNFPHFSTTDLHISPAVANALADMSAYVIKQNLDIFREALTDDEPEEEEDEDKRIDPIYKMVS